jgi:hypothetical protein
MRFVSVRGQDGEWLVMDLQKGARILCTCTGFKAPLNADYICEALQHYHDNLIKKLIGGKDDGNVP